MNPNREEALFALALEKPAGKRAAFLDAMCDGDPALRARLEALLAAHEQPATELAALPAEDPVRRWTLLQPCLAELSRLRRDDLQVARHELNREQWVVKSERLAAEAERQRLIDDRSVNRVGYANLDEVLDAIHKGAASNQPASPHTTMFGG